MCSIRKMINKRISHLLTFLSVCFILSANIATAVTVTYTFSDTFDEYAFDSFFSPVYSPGGSISGSITFDTSLTNPLGNPVSYDITSSIPDVDSSGVTTPDSTFYDSTLSFHTLNNKTGNGAQITSRSAPGGALNVNSYLSFSRDTGSLGDATMTFDLFEKYVTAGLSGSSILIETLDANQRFSSSTTFNLQPIPEPSSIALLIGGTGAVVVMFRRRNS